MKPVLILQHQTPEYPAYLATWLQSKGIPYVAVNAQTSGGFPASIEQYSALAVMGGAMSANDPLMSNRQAEILILQAMYRGKPVIGHCLGGQLIARALGAGVHKSPMPEIGWQPVEWTHTEECREWFGNDPTPHVAHWHYDAFDLPGGAIPLASSGACPYQAFTVDGHLAMQFHIEVDAGKISAWANDIDPVWVEAQSKWPTVQNREAMLDGIPTHMDKHQATADCVYTRWLKDIL